MNAPIMFRWEGNAFVPASPFWQRKADQAFVCHETYPLVEHHERSHATHAHYFAAINEAWQNLPDHLLAEYPNPDALRKKMLVRAGYADERSIVCASKAEAQRVAAFIKPMDIYAVVVVRDNVVRVYTAQSQSYRAMGRKAFQDSKEAVLRALDDLLGVEHGETARSAA